MMKKMPPALLLSSVILLLLPAALDNSKINQLEVLWLIQLLPIFWIFIYQGAKIGGIFTLISILIHSGWEWKENIWEHQYNPYSINILIALTIMKLAFFIGISFVSKKLTNRKKIDQDVYNDFLTGKPNRFFILNYIETLINQSKWNNQPFGVIYLKLNDLQQQNISFPYDREIQLSKLILGKIGDIIPANNIAAKLCDDEFIMILENSLKWQTKKTAEQIINTFIQPIHLNDEELYLSPRIGISMFPDDGRSLNSLLTSADKAMKTAKEIYGDLLQFSDTHTGESILGKIQMELALRNAIENNELYLCYQTQVDIKNADIIGMEALLRWKNPHLGLVPPSDFIPLAEETGLILKIGEWVLEESCHQLKEWHEAGHEMTMAVNVSPRQLQDSGFTNTLKRVLEKEKLDPRFLEIEITESLMQDYDHSITVLNQLKRMGVRLALDDFGTGFSSLSMLTQLPIDHIKIDQSFIRNAAHNHHSNTLIKTIIELAHNLNFNVIAEGIEKEEQIHLLKQYDYIIGQGYYYSRPLPKNKMEEILFNQEKSIV